VAAPVLSAHERVIAAVGIAGPTLRFRGKELVQKVSLVTEIAARLAMALGRLEEHQAGPAFERFPETITLKGTPKE
jgi:hypothetical protein